jgi:hypothetical protein
MGKMIIARAKVAAGEWNGIYIDDVLVLQGLAETILPFTVAKCMIDYQVTEVELKKVNSDWWYDELPEKARLPGNILKVKWEQETWGK